MTGGKTPGREAVPHASFDLAVRLLQAGRPRRAAMVCRTLLQEDPRNVRAIRMLGTIALDQGMLDRAAARFQSALEVEPGSPVLHHSLGIVRKIQGRYEDAIASYDAGLATAPTHEPSIIGKAEALERQGNFDAARALLDPIVASDNADPEAALLYALLEQGAGRESEAAAMLRKHLARPSLPDGQRSKLLFALGRSLERLGDVDGAIAAYHRANAIDIPPFDIDAERAKFDRRIEVFHRDRFAALPRSSNTSEHPVFIVGMPRCGSTLVDQILAAHPSVLSAGESDVMARLVQNLPRTLESDERYPEIVNSLTAEKLDRLSQTYVEQMQELDPSAQRIVDKHLGNFAWLGLIAMLLPKTRIIHCRRDPAAVCFSCYIHPLPSRPHPWAHRLSDLGRYYGEYERLMEHWSSIIDVPMLDVTYEHLVANQEDESRRIVEFCGLDWDDACLRFHETKRAVATISYDQVRRKIYDSSVRRYAAFEPHLESLREALAESTGRRRAGGIGEQDRPEPGAPR